MSYEALRKDFEVMCYFLTPERIPIGNKNPLIVHLRTLVFKSLYINLCNLIRIKKERSTGKEFYEGWIIESLNESKLRPEIKGRLMRRFQRSKDTIRHVKTLRDKFYAHLDKNHTYYVKHTPIHNLEQLVFAIQSVIQKVYGTKKLKSVLDHIPSRYEIALIEN